jgi:hypothetical protein
MIHVLPPTPHRHYYTQGRFNSHKCRGPVANIESSRDPRFLFQAEKATAAILAFLKTTGVGKMPGGERLEG